MDADAMRPTRWPAVAVALLAVAAITLAACGDDEGGSGDGGGGSGDQITIGYSSDILSRPSQADAHVGATNAAKRLGVEVDFGFDASAQGQLGVVQNLLTRGVDVLAINPNDSTAIGTVVQQANNEDVPVVMWIGDNLGAGEREAFIAADERAGAKKIADYVFEKLGGQGKIALIQGDKAHQAGANREAGVRDALKEHPDIELAEYGAAEWDTAKADELARNMLTRTPDIDAFVTVYDGMAQGVVAAVKASGSDALVTGFNGECPTLESVWKGDVSATLNTNWRQVGETVIETAAKVARGQRTEERIVTPSYVIDKEIMQQIVDGEYPNATPALEGSIKDAIEGCQYIDEE